ncbi:MAG: hypothetical protein SFU98_02480 [Leptospiraceae bacterium]|nr:hypothetical protein [Leptospiraceae bacterium]
MKTILISIILILTLFNCREEKKDNTTTTIAALFLLQQSQAQAAAKAKADAIAAKPGCKSLVELTGTGASTAKSLSGRSTTNNEIAIKFTVTGTQKLVLTGVNLPNSLEDRSSVFYNFDACTSGDFAIAATSYTDTVLSNKTRLEITFSPVGSYIYYYVYTGSTNESAYIQ